MSALGTVELKIEVTETDLVLGPDDHRSILVENGYADFQAQLCHGRSITVERLAEAIEALRETHPGIVEHLARGPRRQRYECAVCDAYKSISHLLDTSVERLEEPLWIVYLFHDVPKSFMVRNDQQWYGRFANMTYERCIVTYRLAGWDGEAVEPNA